MSNKRIVLLVLIASWAGLIVASYFMSVRIEGPRNIDTGFRRLDVLFRYQVAAFGVALVAGVLGLAWRKSGKAMLLLGAVPLLATISLVAVLFVGVALFGGQSSPGESDARPIREPAAPAIPVEN